MLWPKKGKSHHYENTPIQMYWKFHHRKHENFQIKNSDIFHISTQNIDCGYSLEPPFHFLVVKFSIYLIRRVFVMHWSIVCCAGNAIKFLQVMTLTLFTLTHFTQKSAVVHRPEVRAAFRIAKISRNIKFILQVRWNENIIYSVINNTLRKHAYSNILKILPPKNGIFLDKKIWYFSYFCSKHRLRVPTIYAFEQK